MSAAVGGGGRRVRSPGSASVILINGNARQCTFLMAMHLCRSMVRAQLREPRPEAGRESAQELVSRDHCQGRESHHHESSGKIHWRDKISNIII